MLICTAAIQNDINKNIENGYFPYNLKNADITPAFKKEYRLLNANYRQVSILATLSKEYENLFIHKFMNILLSFPQII